MSIRGIAKRLAVTSKPPTPYLYSATDAKVVENRHTRAYLLVLLLEIGDFLIETKHTLSSMSALLAECEGKDTNKRAKSQIYLSFSDREYLKRS